MREKFAHNALSFITKYYVYDGKKFDRLKYGLESLYSLITKAFVVIVISIILDIFAATCFLMLFYSLLRLFSFGIHASKSIYCWIFTIATYIICPFIAMNFTFNIYAIVIICALSLIIFGLYAPADTHKRPLINPKKRLFNKISSLLIVSTYILIIFSITDTCIINCMLIALILQMISIHPLTYKIFKMPYRNHINYKKTGN